MGSGSTHYPSTAFRLRLGAASERSRTRLIGLMASVRGRGRSTLRPARPAIESLSPFYSRERSRWILLPSMLRTLLRALPAALLLLAVAGSGCKRGPKEVKASCDMRGSGSSSSSSLCIDFHVEPNAKAAGICKSGGYVLAKTPCPRAASLGGCAKGNLTNWYFAGSRHSTIADVKKECPSDYLPPIAPPTAP
jgi:hypothetical protein